MHQNTTKSKCEQGLNPKLHICKNRISQIRSEGTHIASKIHQMPFFFSHFEQPPDLNKQKMQMGNPKIKKMNNKKTSTLSFLPFHSHLHWSERTHSYCETLQQVYLLCPSLIKLTTKAQQNLTHFNKCYTNPQNPTERNRSETESAWPNSAKRSNFAFLTTRFNTHNTRRNPNPTYRKSHQNQK